MLGHLDRYLRVEVSPPIVDVRPIGWGLKCLPLFVGIVLLDWGSKFLPPYVGAC